jgi:hypothetical protein
MRWLVAGVLVLATTVAAGLVWFKCVVSPTPFGAGSQAALAVLALLVLLCVQSLRALRGRHREAVARAWLSAAAAVGTFVAGDLLAAAMLLSPLSPPTLADRVRHHVLVPGTRSEYATDEYRYVQHVNTLGLRGGEVAVARPPGTRRVLVLGDSFTMGKGVPDADAYPAVIERLLAEDADGVRYEVLNGGVDSYAPVLSLLQLRELVPRLGVDVVVLAVDPGDLLQEEAYRRLAVHDASGQVVAVPARISPGDAVMRWLQRHTYFARHVMLHARRLLAPEPDAQALATVADVRLLRHTVDAQASARAPWDGMLESIAGMAEHCRAHHAGFLIAIYPWGHQVSAREWQAGRRAFLAEGDVAVDHSRRRLLAFAAAAGIDIVDAFPAFRAAAATGDAAAPRLYYDVDMHWTPHGHRLVARVLLEPIRRLLAATASPGPVSPRRARGT